MQTFSEDALDHVEQSIQSLSLEEMESLAAALQSDFDVDFSSDEVASADAEQHEKESSDTGTDDEQPRVRRRDSQTFASASDVEEENATLAQQRFDNKKVRAFKAVLTDVIRKRSQTMTGYSALVVYVGGHATSSPALCDWLADICLAAKAVLSTPSYQVFVAMLETDFERWAELPAVLRSHIMERVGKEMLWRRIVNEKGNTGKYFQQHGGSLLQKRRFAA